MALSLSINKRFSLAGVGEGWGDDCFVLLKAADVATMRQYKQILGDDADLAGLEAVEKEVEILLPRVISGAVMNTNEDGSVERVEFKSDQAQEVLTSLPGTVIDAMFLEMLGLGSLKTSNN